MSLRDDIEQTLLRIATTGIVPGRWFLKPPAPASLPARSGTLDIEIVSHCWQYAHLLAYQLSSLVNFGALFSFLMLHVSVVVYFLIRRRSRAFGVHLLSPVIGFAIIAFVLVNADVHAKVGGLVWLAIGAMVLIGLRLRGRPAATLPMSLSS